MKRFASTGILLFSTLSGLHSARGEGVIESLFNASKMRSTERQQLARARATFENYNCSSIGPNDQYKIQFYTNKKFVFHPDMSRRAKQKQKARFNDLTMEIYTNDGRNKGCSRFSQKKFKKWLDTNPSSCLKKNFQRATEKIRKLKASDYRRKKKYVYQLVLSREDGKVNYGKLSKLYDKTVEALGGHAHATPKSCDWHIKLMATPLKTSPKELYRYGGSSENSIEETPPSEVLH